MFARSAILLRRQPVILRAAIRAQSSAAGDSTRGPVNPFPSSRPGPNATAQPAQQQGELIPTETGDMDAHRSSGLTTSHPSPEIIAADVLNDAPREFWLFLEGLRDYGWSRRTCECSGLEEGGPRGLRSGGADVGRIETPLRPFDTHGRSVVQLHSTVWWTKSRRSGKGGLDA